jgi:outer membrane usher protein
MSLSNRQDLAGLTGGPSSLRRSAFATAILLALGAGQAVAGPADKVMAPDVAALPDVPAGTSKEVEFDSSFMVGDAAKRIDISRFNHAGIVLPGTYSVDVSVKDGWSGREKLTFIAVQGFASAKPCFDKALLTRMGLDWSMLAQATSDHGAAPDPETVFANGPLCGNLGSLIPGASATYNPAEQRLDVAIPQLYLRRSARGWVDPSQWDRGVTAGTLAYSFNSYETGGGSGPTYKSAFLGLDGGLNFGGWRLRHAGTMQWSTHTGMHYQSSQTYLQHDLTAARAQLTIGDSSTDGDMFDSVRFRGVHIASDDRMLPQSQRQFAPVIRGTADTNAQVTVRQRGTVLYQTSVAPGAFQIDDLYPTGYAGDIDVTVTEADGRQKTFTVPYASVPQLVRPGRTEYSVLAGRVNEPYLRHEPNLVQGTWRRGLSNTVTAYAGVTAATGYTAGLVGAAVNTQIGALTFDVTNAHTVLPGGDNQHGYSARIGYSKSITETGTNFSLATYRYSSRGYLGIADAVLARDAFARGRGDDFRRQRSRFDVNINQDFGSSGNIYVTGAAQKYWNGGNDITYSAGYNNRFRSLVYSISAQRTRTLSSSLLPGGFPGAPSFPFGAPGPRRADTTIMLTFSIPLGRPDRGTYLSANLQNATASGAAMQASINDTLGDERQFNYNLTASRQVRQDTETYGGSLQYRGSQVIAGASVGHSGGSNQLSVNASGGVVAHPGGVTLAQSLGDSIAVVHADGAGGATLSGVNNVKLDGRGYAIAPYVTPYELNTVEIDPRGLPMDVELQANTRTVAPRAGAVVMLNYPTLTGRVVLLDARMDDKTALPFGADVYDGDGNNVGVVGQASRIVARGLAERGTVTVSWGSDQGDRCTIDYILPTDAHTRKHKREKADAGYQTLKGTCIRAATSSKSIDGPASSDAAAPVSSITDRVGKTLFDPHPEKRAGAILSMRARAA